MPMIQSTQAVPVKEEVKLDVEPAETVTEETAPPEELSFTESQASRMGWVPKEKWVEAGHDEADWKPAKYFVEYGELVGRIRSQSKEIGDVQQALKFVNDRNRDTFEKGYKQAISDLRTEKRQALQQGDLVKADEIDERLDEAKGELNTLRAQASGVQQAIQMRAPQGQQIDPEHLDWVKRNGWYNTDRVLQKYADAAAIEYIQTNQGRVSPAQVRDFVEKEVKKEFPHKTGGVRGAPNPDGGGRQSDGKSSNSSLSVALQKVKAGLNDSERQIMKTMVKSTGMSEEKYLKMYSQ